MTSENKNTIAPVNKTIGLKEQHLGKAEEIAKQVGLNKVTARILAARGFSANQKLDDFLKPTLKHGLPNPADMLNLSAACQLIQETVEKQDSIAICCDFDVDGLSGGAALKHFFESCAAKVKVFVPDRFTDGYGLNEQIVRKIAEADFKLLIAIDYGSTNHAELELAHQLGLKTIVIDHHLVPAQLPEVDVFINPQQKGCNFAEGTLCAAGLVWYLIAALCSRWPKAVQHQAKSYLDLACLGTICDMVPLIGPNRVIAKRGLELLSISDRPGLVALKNLAGINREVTCHDVAFGLGPRLNAAGRMVHGDMVIDLLTTNDSKIAEKKARSLNRLNQQRQATENRVRKEALASVTKLGRVPAGLVVWGEKFHTGVIGIVAQRLVESFYRPTIVLGADTPGIYKGSVRGIKGFNVVDALSAIRHCLIKYGGHECAGGLSVKEENLKELALAFRSECEKRLANLPATPCVEADTEVSLAELTPELINELKSLAPFGLGNPGPLLLARSLVVRETKLLGNEHTKVMLSDDRFCLNGILWRRRSHPALTPGSAVNIVFKPEINHFGGLSQLQANLQAVETCYER